MPWTDDFERADGGLGDDWTPIGTLQIVSGGVTAAGYGALAVVAGASQSGAQSATVVITFPATNANSAGPAVKVTAGTNPSWYWACLQEWYGNHRAYILGGGGVEGQIYASRSDLAPISGSYTLTLTYDSGVLTLYLDGDQILQASNSALDTAPRIGFYNPGGAMRVESFTTTYTPLSMTIAPDPLWVGGGARPMTATLSGATWTTGVPGSSTVTADHGAISDQWTAATDSIRFTYTPEEYVGPIVFTESEHSLSDTITATLDPTSGGGPGPGQLSPNAIAYLEFSADQGGWGIQNTAKMIGTAPIDTTFIEAIRHVYQFVDFYYPQGEPASGQIDVTRVAAMAAWDALNGGVAQPQGLYSPTTDQPVKLDTEQMLAALQLVTHDGDYNLATVISQIAGSEGYNLTSLLANIPTTDTQPLLDMLSELWGPLQPTLTDMDARVKNLATIDNLSLRDVLQAIDALPKTMDGGYGLADRTANAAGFVAVLLAIAAMAATEAEDAAVSTATGAGVVALAATLAEVAGQILGLLNELKSLLGGGVNEYRAPIWPGQAHVEYGAPIAIESNVPVVGEMHGVRVAIVGCESGTRLFGYDGISSYSHVGALAFGNDMGDLEPFQVLGPAAAFYTPTRMTKAFTCRLFRSRNVRGTITPWKIVS